MSINVKLKKNICAYMMYMLSDLYTLELNE